MCVGGGLVVDFREDDFSVMALFSFFSLGSIHTLYRGAIEGVDIELGAGERLIAALAHLCLRIHTDSRHTGFVALP